MNARAYTYALIVAMLSLLMLSVVTPSAMTAEPASQAKLTALDLQGKAMKDDFDRMLERRGVRVLVPYSRTLFFNDRGSQRGLTADAMHEFEQWLNKKFKTGRRPFTVVAIPTTRDRIFRYLVDGYGDIAAGNLTITEGREEEVDFSRPVAEEIREVVVTGPASPPLANLDDLAGKEIHVRRSSSYYESLTALNERFKSDGKPAIILRLVPDALEDEDMMEMLNAGVIQIIVVDHWKAELWAQVLPKIKVQQLAVRTGGKIGWAMRKGTPKLAEVVNEFITSAQKGGRTAARRLIAYQRRFKQMKNATAGPEWKRFENTIALFRRYGEQYGFDYLMVAAQGYQESRLDQSARSHVGAVGIMQIMPATGKELGVGDITLAEPNVHGGVKYMRRLMDRYFRDADLDQQNRTLFAFASYNAGPGNVAKLRREAQARGLDPNQWFNNVEMVAARRIGQETVQYVRNIYKYYVAYRLELDAREARTSSAKQFR